MQQIGKNNFTFYSRLLSPMLLIGFFYDKPFLNVHQPFGRKELIMFSIVVTFPLLAVVLTTIGVFIQTTTLRISQDSFTILNVLGRSETITFKEIAGYSTTTFLAFMPYGCNGFFLYLHNNRVIELSEFNIKSIKPIYSKLQDHAISYYGHETYWIPFRPIKYKFRNR